MANSDPNKFDLQGALSSFFAVRPPHPDRAELVRTFIQFISTPEGVRLAAAVASDNKDTKLTPPAVIRLGIVHGMAVGVLLERNRDQPGNEFDTRMIVRLYLGDGGLGGLRDQREVQHALRPLVVAEAEGFKKVSEEMAGECEKNGLPPARALQLGLVYGMAVGVIMERDKGKGR